MSDLRLDPLTKRWVVIAPERANRPIETGPNGNKKSGFCPFCPGNENNTPSEIFAVRPYGCKNDANWKVRVIPNKFPTLQIEGNLDRKAEGPYRKMHGIGAHEVIIENPDHSQHIHQAAFDQAKLILNTAKCRMADLKGDKRFLYLLLFKNYGGDAGASLEHPHLQLNAFPITPFEVALELQPCQDYYRNNISCLLCDIADFESQASSRLVIESLYHLAFCPYASRFPYEIMIMPKSSEHKAFFTEINDLQMDDLVQVLQLTLRKLERALDSPSYNLIFHVAPFFDHSPVPNKGETINSDYHWHIHIYPRLTKIAGFELGAQFFINSVYPELAAKKLKETTI